MYLTLFLSLCLPLPPPPFTVMSANQAAEAVCECISSGAEDFLVKPVTKKEVQNIWTHVVKRSRPGRGTEGVPVRLEVRLELGRGAGALGGG